MLCIMRFAKSKNNIFSVFAAMRPDFVVFFQYAESKKQQMPCIKRLQAEIPEKML